VDRDYLGQVLNCLWTGTANGRPSPTGFTAESRTGLWAYPGPLIFTSGRSTTADGP
jgi:hypothetical protein